MTCVMKIGILFPLPGRQLNLCGQSEHLQPPGVVWMNVLRAYHLRKLCGVQRSLGSLPALSAWLVDVASMYLYEA